MSGLNRKLGFWQVTLSGVGIILGAGIYALVGKAALLGGNAVWISFIIAAIVATFSGLSFAELSSIFPKASAEYAYTKKAFGRMIAFSIGWLVIFSGIISSATVALGFAGYYNALFGTSILITAIVLVFIVSLLLYRGVEISANIAVVFTLIEAAGLLLIIFVGIPYIDFSSIDYFAMPSFSGLFSAAALIFFAFIGFEDLVRLSEEAKNPKKTVPKAVVAAIIITTIIYILVAVSSISVLGAEQLGSSTAPLSDVASKALGSQTFNVLTIIALFATANTVLLLLLSTSRITYGMAVGDSLPNQFSLLHKKNKTPWFAILVLGLITILFLFVDDIATIANLTNFTVFVSFIAINLALIVLRYKMPNVKREFKTPINIGKFPVLAFLGIITCIIMLFSLSSEILIYGSILTLVGLVLSIIFVKKIKPINPNYFGKKLK